MVNNAIACHTQERLLRILLPKLIIHFLAFVEAWPELDGRCWCRVGALLGDLALSLILED